ncbi:MAG: sulfatase [Phycisphaerae bacterium]
MSTQPNVLFILSDQHHAQVMSCRDHPDVETPNLDALAGDGVLFENAITQNPICTPSRVCFLSGQYCHNHGYYGLSGPNPGGLPNLLGHFRRYGYATTAIGKIHCPEYWIEDDADVFHETCDCSIGGRSRKYQGYLDQKGVDEDHQALIEIGPRGWKQGVDGRPSLFSYEDSMEGWSVREAADFMRACRDEGKPFFAHVSLPKPHQCYTPAQEFWDLYEDKELTLPPNADYDLAAGRKAPHLIAAAEHWRKGGWTVFDPPGFEAGRLRKLQGYLGSVSQVDHAVGELMSFLDQTGLGEDTIVVYSADHGDYVCQHGIMEKAPGICSDAITRIPMIWRVPGRTKGGHTPASLVEAVDMAPTLCGLAGLPAMPTADGKDISALLGGGDEPVRSAAFTEFAWSKSVRKGPWRLVWYPREFFAEEYPDGFGELYNLDDDPWEMSNRWFDDDVRNVRADLQRELADWLVTTTRPTTILTQAWLKGEYVRRRYNNDVLADGSVPPEYISERVRANRKNYL